jgi:hypothetical protein
MPPLDDPGLDVAARVSGGERGQELAAVVGDPGDIGEQDQLLGPGGHRQVGGEGVGVDVEGLSAGIDRQRRDDRDERRAAGDR